MQGSDTGEFVCDCMSGHAGQGGGDHERGGCGGRALASFSDLLRSLLLDRTRESCRGSSGMPSRKRLYVKGRGRRQGAPGAPRIPEGNHGFEERKPGQD